MEKNFNAKFLKFTIAKKQRNSIVCKQCTLEISVGENYLTIEYDDGYNKKFIGGLHEDCFNDYNKQHKF